MTNTMTKLPIWAAAWSYRIQPTTQHGRDDQSSTDVEEFALAHYSLEQEIG